MRLIKRTSLSLAICAAFGVGVVRAAELDLSVQIPQLDVAEYHRPYVAAWVEREDKSVAAQLLVWYQQKRSGGGMGAAQEKPAEAAKSGNAAKPAEGSKAAGAAPQQQAGEVGTKWLPDLRQWWRRGGREMSVPVDGVTGATRAVGEHKVSFVQGKAPLGDLAPGKYKLVVEAAREEGGRELVDIPFTWPATGTQELKAQGKTELGAVTLALKP